MRTTILLALCLLLSACASTPASPPGAEANQPSAAANQPTAASPATADASPTAEPSPTAVPLPYSGPNPRLAVIRWELAGEREDGFIDVIELGSEKLVASIPIDDSWIFSLSPDGRKLFNFALSSKTGTIYDLESGESRAIDLSAQVSEGGGLGQVVWSPSQQWLSFTAHNDGNASSWAYSLETGDLKQFADSRIRNWSSTEEILSYIRGNLRATYNLATGQETVWPEPSFERLTALLTHDGLQPDFNSRSCEICVHPELGLVRDFMSYNRSIGLYYYDLVDFETAELLANVATFRTERDLSREYYTPYVVKLLPLWGRGDYLLFVQHSVGPALMELEMHVYSAWSLSGEMPFTIVEGEQTNTLPNVIPMALSPDGSSFVGFRLAQSAEYTSLFMAESAVVVDLATAEILYEYPVPYEFAYFSPPDDMNAVDIVWPGE